MDTFEAKNLLADSLRCLARSMEQIRLREIEKVAGDDEPMQDHLAECTWAEVPDEDMEVKDCCEYLLRLYNGFSKAAEHEDLMCSKYRLGQSDIGHLCDIVRGYIGHGFPDDLNACATEIYSEYRTALRALGHYTKSKKGCDQFVRDLLKKAIEIIKKHDQQSWNDGEYSITIGYLDSWLERQYWNN